MYLLASLAVLATAFERRKPLDAGPGVPGAQHGGDPAETAEARILREVERAGLRKLEKQFEPGDRIFTPGDPDDQLFFLHSGVVRIYKTYGDFKEATTALLKDEGIIGKPDLEESGIQEDFAEALTETRVIAVRKPAVVWLVKRHPELALSLVSALAERVRRSDELVVSLLPREVSSRLAALLLNLGDRFGEKHETGIALDLRLTHQGLASMVASTREAVSKAMSEFRQEGLIEVQSQKVVILDPHALAGRTDGRPRLGE